MFCCVDPRTVEAGIRLKQAKYLVSVTTAGDVFEAPAFTTFGTPYDSAIRLFKSIAHNGDSVPAAAGHDVPRFQHEASSWATPNHLVFSVHLAALAAARAASAAMVQYAKRRTVGNYVTEAVANLPAPVPCPLARAL